tara:strand:- start:43123 stop:43287 length:165 start_codon:yes stop_codon:yes gene_type:complete
MNQLITEISDTCRVYLTIGLYFVAFFLNNKRFSLIFRENKKALKSLILSAFLFI